MIKLKNLLGEAKEIGGYYLMKQLKDLAQDAKRSGERKVAKALMYLYDRINQSSRDIDLNADDINDFLNEPRGRTHARDLPDWMVDDLFEGINEAKARAGDYVKVITGEVGQINKVRGTLAWIKLASDSKSFWPSDIRKLKPAGKEKGKALWTEAIQGNEIHAKSKRELNKALEQTFKQLSNGKQPKHDIINGMSGEYIGLRMKDGGYELISSAIQSAMRELP